MSGWGHDEELPAGFQDADLEMRELGELGRRESELAAKGICTHGAFVVEKEDGPATCSHCLAVFADQEALMEDRYEKLN